MHAPSTPPGPTAAAPGARAALALLLLINLFNYIDRQVLAAVEHDIAKDFFPKEPTSVATMAKMGSGTATVTSPAPPRRAPLPQSTAAPDIPRLPATTKSLP